MANLFAALDQFFCWGATLHLQSVNALAQIISKAKHFLKRQGQLRQVFQAVTTRAKLRPAEGFRGRANAVYTVTFNTIKPCGVRAGRDVTTALEEIERLAMTGAAHLERRSCIRLCDEMTIVGFSLFRLR